MKFSLDIITSIMSTLTRLLDTHIILLNMQTFKQNSAEWHKNRKKTIGSSEIFDASGTETSKKKIIDRKRGLGPNLNGVPAIIWGNVMESSTQLVTETLLGCKVRNVNGSILCQTVLDDFGNPINSDSPDGLGVIQIPVEVYREMRPYSIDQLDIYGQTRFGRKSSDRELLIFPYLSGINQLPPPEQGYSPPVEGCNLGDIELCAHFEYKSPKSRKIEPGKISDEYLFQKLSGLDIFNRICQIGVFSEVRFSNVNYFSYDPITLYDHHTKKDYPCYFALTKYIFVFGQSSPMMPYDDKCLQGKTVVQDYEVVDGPYMYNFGNGFVFCDNEIRSKLGDFQCDQPQNVEEFAGYCSELNTFLSQSKKVPNYYMFNQVDEFSIKLIRKVVGFVSNFRDHCIDILQQAAQ